jgi:hypothetical protein
MKTNMDTKTRTVGTPGIALRLLIGFAAILGVVFLLTLGSPFSVYAAEEEEAITPPAAEEAADAVSAPAAEEVITPPAPDAGEESVTPPPEGAEDSPEAEGDSGQESGVISPPREELSETPGIAAVEDAAVSTTLESASDFAGGSGTAEDPYRISTAVHLDAVRTQLTSNFLITNDIDLKDFLSENGPGYNEGRGWLPIGDVYASAFRGILDGNGFKIIGLWLDRDDAEDATQYQGLFGMIGRATVKNLTVVLDAKGIHGKGMTGGLAGGIGSGGRVENCAVIGEGSVNATGDRVGGLVGSGASIYSSFATVDVNGAKGVGGLVGFNTGLITDSYATGNVTGDTSIGGFVGSNSSMIEKSFANGNVNGASDVGGFAGANQGSLTNVYSTGNAYGNFYIGGLVGGGGGQIANSFASGTATGYHENPYYTGGLRGGGNAYGIDNSFYLGQTVAGNNGFGAQTTVEQLRQAAIDAGWDFDNIWTNWTTGLLPHLKTEVPPVINTGNSNELINNTPSNNASAAAAQVSRTPVRTLAARLPAADAQTPPIAAGANSLRSENSAQATLPEQNAASQPETIGDLNVPTTVSEDAQSNNALPIAVMIIIIAAVAVLLVLGIKKRQGGTES